MNAMVLVEKARVIAANNKSQRLQEMRCGGEFVVAVAQTYAQCLEDLGLLGYDPVKEQQDIEKIYNEFYGEEDNLK